MATLKTFILIAIIGLAVISGALAAPASCDSCPQCIILRPICATFHSQYATNNRRGFPSECHMHCYNRCHGTNYFKLSYGSKCI
ncbi:locustin-like [Periplaneta americana]|uniref:locustin-like n=1 Tax=Periplaneta americana TaxID=6978 RepID=UPI0037E9BCC8